MLQNGSHHHHHHHQHHHPRDQKDEGMWRQLLRNAMLILNMRAHIADCKEGSRTPSQPQIDYYAFNPHDRDSVEAQAPAVIKCLDAIRQTARTAKAALPPIEALPLAIRQCTQQLIVEYLEDWANGRP
jgi:hypothetical protein